MIITNLTDKELYEQSEIYSKLIRKYRNKFIALLPEINKRRLYEKHNMTSIFQFAAIKAGLSHDSVRMILKLKEDIKELPKLNEKFESGDVGWSKIAVVSRIATPENETILVEKLDTMTQETLKVMVKEIKIDNLSQEQNNLFQQNEVNFGFPGISALESHSDFEKKENLTIKLDPNALSRFRVMKNKISKEFGREITWQEAIEKLMDHYDQPKPNPKIQKYIKRKPPKAITRHIPVETARRVVIERNGICQTLNCRKPATTIHHTIPFALQRSHAHLESLCEQHHELKHHGIDHTNKILQQLELTEYSQMNDINKKYQKMKMRL